MEESLLLLVSGVGAGLLLACAWVESRVRLGIYGHDLRATDADVVAEMRALASGHVSEEELATWIRQHMRKRK